MTSFFYSIQGGILILFFMSMKVFLDSQLSSLVFFLQITYIVMMWIYEAC